MAYRGNQSSIVFGDAGPAPTRTAARGASQGGSQNVNNTLGDVPSVRLYAPPGGSSSISFGGEEPQMAAPRQAAPAPWGMSEPAAPAPMYQQQAPPAAYQQPAPPQAYMPAPSSAPYGQDMGGGTRTAYRAPSQGGSQKVGNTLGDVPSVKLHAPPGGASSISFGGGYDAPAPVQQRAPAPYAAAPAPAAYQQPAPAAYQQPVYQQQQAPAAYQPAHAPQGGYVPSTQNFGDGAKAAARTASRGASQGGSQNVGNTIGSVPSVKLHAPPGGASSISFG